MQKSFVLWSFVALILLAACGQSVPDLTQDYKWATYSDPSGFSLELPEHWLVAPRGNTPMTVLTALIPAEDSSDLIQERITVTRKRRTIEELADAQTHRKANEEMIRKSFPDIEFLQSKEVASEVGDAYIIESRQASDSKQWYQLCIIREQWIYTLTYAASTDTYGHYINAIKNSFESFSFDQQI